ncbi:MAG: S-layer homology domain-containing protein [Bilifractor sp.]|jgi:hypothetical protein
MKKRLSKLIPSVLAAAVILSVTPAVYADTSQQANAAPLFSDIRSDAWYHDAVYWAAGKGITSGTSETTFSPDRTCTRGQIVTFLWRYMGSPHTSLAGNPFTDINGSQYYAEGVMWAKNNNITSGTRSTTFGGEQTIDRKQAITFLWRLEGSKEPAGSSGFSDVSAGKYYSKAVAWAVENHITNGIGNNRFGPDLPCTRAQIVKLIANTESTVKNEDRDKPYNPNNTNTGTSNNRNTSENAGKTNNGNARTPNNETTSENTGNTNSGNSGKTDNGITSGGTGETGNRNTGSSDSGSITTQEHNWVPVKKTVHHDAAGHYEKVQIGTKTVVDEEAYDEQVDTGTAQCICNKCGWTTTDNLAMIDHVAVEGGSYRVESVYKTIHHDAVTHEEPVCTQNWVQDTAAYDETVITGYKCSECGAVK